jgi:opacity protein-like surface antigen
MFKLRTIALAACATVAAAMPAAEAADIPPPIPPIVMKGWYLRGDIGYSNQQVESLGNVLFPGTADLVFHTLNFEAGPTFGVGIGYRLSHWFRFDLTGEYRGETEFHGFDTWTDVNGDPRFNDYTAKKSEWLVLANAYLDLGTWHGITPFVGGGLGAVNVAMRSFRDAGIAYGTPGDPATGFPTMAYAGDADRWNLAWALYAGLGLEVTDAFTVELGYRYLDMGDGETGDIIAFDGTNTVDNPMIFEDLTSHDVRLGVRYSFW